VLCLCVLCCALCVVSLCVVCCVFSVVFMQIVLHPYVSNSSLFVPEHILLLISDPHTEKGEERYNWFL